MMTSYGECNGNRTRAASVYEDPNQEKHCSNIEFNSQTGLIRIQFTVKDVFIAKRNMFTSVNTTRVNITRAKTIRERRVGNHL